MNKYANFRAGNPAAEYPPARQNSANYDGLSSRDPLLLALPRPIFSIKQHCQNLDFGKVLNDSAETALSAMPA
jgi:hypothetical protein